MRRAQVRFLALLIVLSFIGGVLALAFPRQPKKHVTVTAYFTKAIGLFPSSKVRVLGVPVGKVETVTPVGTKAKVVMTLDPEQKIPADARAVIVPISLIADRYIQLTPVWSSGPMLRNGAVIDTDRTSVPAELDDLLAQLKKFLDAVQAGTRSHPESLGLAVKNLANALAGAGPDLAKALGGAGALSGAITQNAPEIDAIVGQLSRLFAALSARRVELATLNARLAQALGAIAEENDSLDGTLSNLALFTEQLGSVVKDHRQDLEYDLNVLAKTTKEVVDHQQSLTRGASWLPVLFDAAENEHNGGALHTDAAVPHIDVRDAHEFPCPVAVPAAVCLLLALSGGTLPIDLPLPATAPQGPGASAAPGATATPAPSPSASNPADLLHLLPTVDPLHLQGGAATGSPPSLFNGIGGFFDRMFGWLL